MRVFTLDAYELPTINSLWP